MLLTKTIKKGCMIWKLGYLTLVKYLWKKNIGKNLESRQKKRVNREIGSTFKQRRNINNPSFVSEIKCRVSRSIWRGLTLSEGVKGCSKGPTKDGQSWSWFLIGEEWWMIKRYGRKLKKTAPGVRTTTLFWLFNLRLRTSLEMQWSLIHCNESRRQKVNTFLISSCWSKQWHPG